MNTSRSNRSVWFGVIALLLSSFFVGGWPGWALARVAEDGPTPQATPTALPPEALVPLKGMTAISAGGLHTCALTREGGVQCWGYNSNGELGDGTTEARYVPVDVAGLTSGVIIAVTAGQDHTCALTASGGVKCWGNNYNGQLGDGSTEDSLVPVDVVGLTNGVIAIAASSDHTCAVTVSGGVKCWGFNAWGLAGEDTVDSSSTPVDVNGLAGVTGITAGENHTCALTGEGGVKCWGATGFLGLASFDNGPVDVPGLADGVTAIAAGAGHTCAVKGDRVLCWGANGSGQLGNGAQTDVELTPVEVNGLSGDIVALAAGATHSCALMGNGGVRCWGGNSLGQLGDGTVSLRTTPVPVSGLGGKATAIAAGYIHTCALLEAGSVECWGVQRTGLLGDGDADPGQHSPVAVSGLNREVTAIGSGQTTSCAALQAGGVECWGLTGSYLEGMQISEGASVNSGAPAAVAGLRDTMAALAVGDAHTCALTASNGVACWGDNTQGQLGDGTDERRESFVQASGLSNGVAAIAVGGDHTCALNINGGVQCWGDNYYGQLGDGSTEDRSSPVTVVGLTSGVTAIAAGDDHTCALLNDGRVKCWGNNNFGRLGDGANDDRNTPVDVVGLSGRAMAIAAGDAHTCAALDAGGAQCWGRNSDGELGDGTTDYRDGLVTVSNLSGNITSLTAGHSHTCALTGDGGVKCWGDNTFGQLGDDTTMDRLSPINVKGMSSGVAAVAAGDVHTCALTRDGAVRCWGNNEFGQLGDDTLIRKTPGAVMTVSPAGFRPPSILVPELTTHIPTPLDVSTSPPVVGANLLLAGVATILFTIASELLNNLLAENEVALQRALRPAQWLGPRVQRFESLLGARLSRPRLLDAIKVGGIVLFYGLIFSLLQKGWNPLSVTGLYLFFIMAVAFGLVGTADDIAKWNAARRWGVPTSLTLRPANLVLALASTSFSRLFGLIPGLMFGMPEAFEVDRQALDNRKEVKLLAAGSGAILAIGFGVWLLTIVTALLQKADLPGALAALIGGLESLLLILFAVSVQNAFLQVLALPDSYGRALLKWNRWIWAAALLGITFLFYHTLINPRGELATALNAANVRFFFITVFVFLLGTLSVWMYFKWTRRQEARKAAPPQIAGPAASTPAPPTAPEPVIRPIEPPIQETAPQPVATPVAERVCEVSEIVVKVPRSNGNETTALETAPAVALEAALPADSKHCPACGQVIKAEARLCRYCRATFEIAVKGYCLNCHTVVEVDKGRCRQCGNEVIDRHLESIVLTKPTAQRVVPVAPPSQPAQPVARPGHKLFSWWWVLGIILGISLCGSALFVGAMWLRESAAVVASPIATETQTPTTTPTLTRTPTPTRTPKPRPTRTPKPGPTFTPVVTSDGTGQVTGNVVWGGQPFAGVTVKLCERWLFTCQSQEYKAVTDANGRFTITAIPPGDYNLVTQLPGQAGETRWVGGPTSQPIVVKVSAGQSVTLESIRVVKGDLHLISPLGTINNTTPILKWEAYPNAAKYFVDLYAVDMSEGGFGCGWVTARQCIVSRPLSPGKQYEWRVSVQGPQGELARAYGRFTLAP